MQTKLANDSFPRALRRRNRRDNEIGVFRLCKGTDGKLTAKTRVSAQFGQAARR